jgi:hypothetical protein
MAGGAINAAIARKNATEQHLTILPWLIEATLSRPRVAVKPATSPGTGPSHLAMQRLNELVAAAVARSLSRRFSARI